jgi:transposase
MPPRSDRKKLRPFDKEIYKARHLIEHFYCSLKRFRAMATRYAGPPLISSPLSTSLPLSLGSIEDRP